MRQRISRLYIFSLVISLPLVSLAQGKDQAPERPAVLLPTGEVGVHPSPSGRFNATVRQNGMNGGRDLFVMKGNEPLFYAADINSIVWVGDRLIYAAGPLYGPSGIFLYEPVVEQTSALRPGNDDEYFELKLVRAKESRLEYYYSSDVKQLDVDKLKASAEAVQSVELPTRELPTR